MSSITPYQYSYNNPISFSDPTGLMPGGDEPDGGPPAPPEGYLSGAYGGNSSDYNFGTQGSSQVHWTDFVRSEDAQLQKDYFMLSTSEFDKKYGNPDSKERAEKAKSYGTSIGYVVNTDDAMYLYTDKSFQDLKGYYRSQRIEVQSSGGGDGIWPYGSPVAWSIGVDLDVIVGVGGDMNPISYGTILQGKDKGTGFTLSDGGIGVGLDVSGSVEGTLYFYTGDLNDFSVNSLNGPRVEGNFGASFFADLGVGFAVSEVDRFGGRVIAVKGFIGAGIPTYVGGNVNWGETFIQKIIK